MGKYQFSYEEKITIIREHEENHKTLKEAAEILQPLCYVGYLSSALASASWKSLVSVKSSFL